MNWNLDGITSSGRTVFATFTIEGGTSTWLKKFAASRKVSKAHAIRMLIAQAVRFWQANRQLLDRKAPYPFALFTGRGEHTRPTCVTLDSDVFEGLREIAAITGKTNSRVVSEILLDAKQAHEAILCERADLHGAFHGKDTAA